jgi:hypothetical protein
MTKKPKPKRNPTDPLLLAREVVETAIGEPLSTAKPSKTSSRKQKKK